MLLTRIIDKVARTDGPRVLAGLIRLTGGDFDAAEDALQEAYARALVAWRRDGLPAQPGAWINTVSRRLLIDALRRETTRRKRSTSLDGDVADATAIAMPVADADGPGPLTRQASTTTGFGCSSCAAILRFARSAEDARAANPRRLDDARDRARVRRA